VIIGVDFDDTLFKENPDGSVGEPMKDNIEAVKKLYEMGHIIRIISNRPSDEIKKYVEENKIPVHRINELEIEAADIPDAGTGKPFYDVFMDDSTVNPNIFDGADAVVEEMLRLGKAREDIRKELHPENVPTPTESVKVGNLYSALDEATDVLEFDWKKAVAAGAIGLAAATSPMMTGTADAKQAVHQTIGQINNNPINLKAFEDWKGMTGKDKYGHAIFKDLEHGIRASYINLSNHKRKHPDETLLEYMKTFAEANQKPEAEFIAKHLGITVDTKLKDINIDDMLIAMSKFESKIVLQKSNVEDAKRKFGLK